MDFNKFISHFRKDLPTDFKITNEDHLLKILSITDQLLAIYDDFERLSAFEQIALKDKSSQAIAINLIAKLAISKYRIQQLDKSIFVSVVFAVYKEHNRIRKQSEHPNGENFLLQKVNQLNWLFEGPQVDWELLVVDDGCPENSGQIAQKIVDDEGLNSHVKVLFLQDAIDQQLPISQPLTSTNQSRKGGSIQYGMWHAAQNKRENHFILFTDADLSTHLGQSGLLIHELVNGANAAIGSRREDNSVSIKKGTRNTRGKLFIYLWQQNLSTINYITDTQCGFKGFKAEVIRQILDQTLEKQFAFDIELLVKTDLIQHQSIEKVGIAWIDSEAESTTTDLQPYLSMLNMATKIYHTYLPTNERAEDFASFIKSLSEEQWHELVNNVPEEIANREPSTFREWEGLPIERFRAVLA